jgi:hypothetical protein
VPVAVPVHSFGRIPFNYLRFGGEEGPREVNAYLRAEIEHEPARLGKLAKWFFPHDLIVGTNKEGLFKLLSEGTLKELRDRFGEKTWSSDDERRAVERLRPLVQ